MKGARALSPLEIQAVCVAFSGQFAVRNRTLFLLCANIGARITEALNLNVGDVFQNGEIVDVLYLRRETVKGKREGVALTLPSGARNALAGYLKWESHIGGNHMIIYQKANKEAAEKVEYEWNMVDVLYTELRKYREERIRKRDKLDLEDKVRGNAFLESFLIHIRNLYYFLCKEPHGDDVVAKHFFVNNQQDHDWESKRETLIPCDIKKQIETKEDNLINKHLAHLTYTRLENKPSWDFESYHEAFKIAWKEFLRTLPEERKNWFSTSSSKSPSGDSTLSQSKSKDKLLTDSLPLSAALSTTPIIKSN